MSPLLSSQARYSHTRTDRRWTVESQIHFWLGFPSRHRREDDPDWPHVSAGSNEHDDHWMHDDILQVRTYTISIITWGSNLFVMPHFLTRTRKSSLHLYNRFFKVQPFLLRTLCIVLAYDSPVCNLAEQLQPCCCGSGLISLSMQ